MSKKVRGFMCLQKEGAVISMSLKDFQKIYPVNLSPMDDPIEVYVEIDFGGIHEDLVKITPMEKT